MKSKVRSSRNAAPLAAKLLAAGLAVALAAPAPAAAQGSAEKVMKKLADMNIDFMGMVVDIPDRQNLGVRQVASGADRNRGADPTRGGTVVYLWDERPTPDDKSAPEHLLTIHHLQAAGIPAGPGREIDFQEGMAGANRYRMGGAITNIDIRGSDRYEVRVTVDWKLYDTKSSKVIWEGSSSDMARGAVLGERGEQPNVLMDATIGALDKVLDKEVKKAL
ncbi:MAG: hypothetical protein PVF05_09905 [Gemmatimonadales bacterium]|jgi:hypothetical protein